VAKDSLPSDAELATAASAYLAADEEERQTRNRLVVMLKKRSEMSIVYNGYVIRRGDLSGNVLEVESHLQVG